VVGPAQAFQGSDQAAALVNSIVPLSKGGIFGLTQSFTASSEELASTSSLLMDDVAKDLGHVKMTNPSFCTSCNERVYITVSGCEIGFGGAQGLQAAGAGGL